MKECNQYDNWCEKEKRSCKNCYYEIGYNMSDEEKKAIEDLKEVIDLYNDGCLITTVDDIKSIDIVLNLIEKQQKEIEELKAINKKLEARKYMYNAETGEVTAIPIDNNYISKAKIKAKIEELENENMNENESLEIFYRRKYCYEILQSLLEKE